MKADSSDTPLAGKNSMVCRCKHGEADHLQSQYACLNEGCECYLFMEVQK